MLVLRNIGVCVQIQQAIIQGIADAEEDVGLTVGLSRDAMRR